MNDKKLELDVSRRPTLKELMRQYAALILEDNRGHKCATATQLGINRRTLYRWLRTNSTKKKEESNV